MRSELPDGWVDAQLGDYVDLLVGFAFKSTEFTEDQNGMRLLRGDNVGQGRLRWKGARCLPAYRSSDFSRYELCLRDIVLAMDRPWIDAGLKYAVVAEEDLPCLLVQRVARLRGASELSQQYLRYVIGSPEFAGYVQAVQTGTAVPHISGRQIAEFRCRLPPVSEQECIAAALGALDDKIDSNHRLAALLEQTAAAMFRARFVEFLGVENFKKSEIGPIPQGWSVGVLSDVATIKMGQSPPGSTYTDDPDSGVLLVQGMGGFGERYPTSATWTSAPTKSVPPGATLMTVRAPVGAVNVSCSEVCVGRGVAGIHSDHPAFTEFLVRSLRSRWASEESGTIFPAVNRKQILGMPVVVPPETEVEDYEVFAHPFIDRMLSLHTETERLTALRDALLPKLVSGKIRVPDTADPDEAIGAVAEEIAG